MKKSPQIAVLNQGRDTASAELVNDTDHGPVIWLQTNADGCYIPVDRLDEFIDGLKKVAASQPQASNAA
jgi:hypothetical protein